MSDNPSLPHDPPPVERVSGEIVDQRPAGPRYGDMFERPPAPPAQSRRFLPSITRWTAIVLFANCVVYLASVLWGGDLRRFVGGPDPQTFIREGADSAYFVFAAHQWWRLFTYQVLHAGLLHIGFNMYALAILAPITEKLWGRARWLTMYLLSGAFAGLFAAAIRFWPLIHYWHGGLAGGIDLDAAFAASKDATILALTPAIGASGALMGLMGAILATTFKKDTLANPALRKIAIQWAASVFIFGFIIHADNLAHLGGLIGGFLCGLAFSEVWRPRRLPGVVFAVAAAAFAACTIFGFATAALHPIGLSAL